MAAVDAFVPECFFSRGSSNPAEPNEIPEAPAVRVLCPVCGKDLGRITDTQVGREAHVNACLERIGYSPTADGVEVGAQDGEVVPTPPPVRRVVNVLARRPANEAGGGTALGGTSKRRKLPADAAEAAAAAAAVDEDDDVIACRTTFAHGAPKWRVIPGTPGPFAVDCFTTRESKSLTQTRSWFLTHYHYDHYGGLTKKWCASKRGRIFCTKITAKLVHRMLGVSLEALHVLELDTPTVVEGVRVTASRLLGRRRGPGRRRPGRRPGGHP